MSSLSAINTMLQQAQEEMAAKEAELQRQKDDLARERAAFVEEMAKERAKFASSPSTHNSAGGFSGALLPGTTAAVPFPGAPPEPPPAFSCSMTSPSSQVITINVGGTMFTTTVKTLLESEPKSVFAAMLTGRREVLRDREGNIFIDHDGARFGHVLNWLRTKHVPGGAELGQLLVGESLFFRLEELREELQGPLISSSILTRDMAWSLAGMFPRTWGKIKFKLLFTGSKETTSRNLVVLNQVSNNGIVLCIKATTDYVFGAYIFNPTPFDDHLGWENGNQSIFLFSFGTDNQPPYPLKLCHSGLGHGINKSLATGLHLSEDLVLFSTKGSRNTCHPMIYTIIPPAYRSPGLVLDDSTLTGAASFTVAQVEAYEVTFNSL
ncbi:hypothetical protein Pelo_13522 [Pelomyxa schiedti]|nr:hypothetical protein Pelo_13522 [Pelomyxa schiedti]